MLAEVGYGALTMDALASQAVVGKATIYRRWRTKQDLVIDIIAELNQAEIISPHTGSRQTDLRHLLHSLVDMDRWRRSAPVLAARTRSSTAQRRRSAPGSGRCRRSTHLHPQDLCEGYGYPRLSDVRKGKIFREKLHAAARTTGPPPGPVTLEVWFKPEPSFRLTRTQVGTSLRV
ncbi:helix-turn-helix domain-containing protein [Geodermatophilus nigrescens]